MAITQKDIAKKLNLSINTVSRALRDMPDIRAETRQLIQATASEMGYRKNLAASRLRTNCSHLLGVVVPDFSNPAIGTFIHGVEAIAKQSGFTLMLGSTKETREDETAVISSMLAQGVDGFVLIPSMLNEPILDQIEHSGTPYVLAMRSYPGRRCNAVRSNDQIGGALVAQHLYAQGHRHFLYVSGLDYISSARERYEGFLSVLRGKGLDSSALQVLRCNGTRAGACRAVSDWLQQTSSLPAATAIFAFSDYVACGVYEALRARQLQIPEDVSVVGYDNNEFANLLIPPLSTVDNDFFEMGRRSMERLLLLMQNPDTAPMDQITLPELVLRGSTSAPRTAPAV